MSRETGCIDKRVYFSFIEAKIFARRTNETIGGTVHPYKCQYCEYFHIGGSHKKGDKDERK